MKNSTSCLAALAVVAALTTAQTVSAAGPHSRYSITDLGTLPGLTNSYVWQQTLNNRGHVAVYANNLPNPSALVGDSSFLWKKPGDVKVLPGLPGATETIVFGLNDRDQAVGHSLSAADSQNHAVLWKGGKVHDLGMLPEDTSSDANMINNDGIVVGTSYGENVSAVYWNHDQICGLPPLDGAVFSTAYGINERGLIVGESGLDVSRVHAVLWHSSPKPGVIDLGTLGGDYSWASAINDRGDIVGQAQAANGNWHATLWRGNRIIALQNFGADPFGCAFAINGGGQIAGFSGVDFSDPTTAHALLWEGGKVINLQTQLPSASGWVLLAALSINDAGQIAGFGLHKGKIRPFLLTQE